MIYIEGKSRAPVQVCVRGMRVNTNTRIHNCSDKRLIAHSLSLSLRALSLPFSLSLFLALFTFIYLYNKIRTKSNNFLHLQDRTSGSRPVRCCKCVHVLLDSVLYCLSDEYVCLCVSAYMRMHSSYQYKQIVLLIQTSQ